MELDLPGTTEGLAVPVERRVEWHPRRELILVGVTLAVLLPFVNRAFNIDEPLFIWAAQQIQKHPGDPYGFPVNWYGTAMWMSDVMKNPPLASYFIAAVGSVFGMSEVALHVAFMVPAMALVVGTYRLALRLTDRPMLAAVLGLLSPVTLICATSVMCDVMMLALWVWAVHWWMRGLRENRSALLLLAGALAGLSALTKYFGVSLIPLMLAVALVHRRGRPGACLFAMLIPIAMLIAYEIWTNRLYFPGKFILHGHLADALFYSADYRARMGTQRLGALATGLVFAGGACVGLVPFLIGGMNRWGWITTASIAVIILALVALINPFPQGSPLRGESGLAVGYFVQFAALCVVGTGALVLAGAGLRHWRLSDSVLLALWVLGTFVFAAMVNWSVNGRSILPMVPAAAIIVCRQMDRVRERPARWEMSWGIVPAAALSLICAMADASLAGTSRSAAREILARASRYEGSPLQINGKWGFQYYLQLGGGRPLDQKAYKFTRGDLIAIAYNNTNVLKLRMEAADYEQLLVISRVPFPFVAIMNMQAHAGFYSDAFGPMPLVLGKAPPDEFELIMLTSGRFPSRGGP